jgi:hypothetical protein
VSNLFGARELLTSDDRTKAGFSQGKTPVLNFGVTSAHVYKLKARKI